MLAFYLPFLTTYSQQPDGLLGNLKLFLLNMNNTEAVASSTTSSFFDIFTESPRAAPSPSCGSSPSEGVAGQLGLRVEDLRATIEEYYTDAQPDKYSSFMAALDSAVA